MGTDTLIVILTERHEKFKYCVISLNMPHTAGLCGILGYTAPL